MEAHGGSWKFHGEFGEVLRSNGLRGLTCVMWMAYAYPNSVTFGFERGKGHYVSEGEWQREGEVEP